MGVKQLTPEMAAPAREIAVQYRYIIEPDGRGGFIGTTEELPAGVARADTPEECLRQTIIAMTLGVATYIDMGQTPPKPVTSAVAAA